MLDILDKLSRLERRIDRAMAPEKQASRSRSTSQLPILDFIPAVTPRWERPVHLRALTEALERAETEPVRALCSVPPRHSKSETLLHAVARWLARHPEQTVAYVTYSDTLTKSKSRLARRYALEAGVELADDAAKLNEWRTKQGGGALFTSVGGSFTGQGCDLLIIDDPHKDRAEAESQLIRDTTYDWYRGTAYSRVEPRGSVIVTHTRWHPDDLIGRLLTDEDEDWETVFLPAISDSGAALWPSRWPVAELLKKKAGVGEYEWASLYMGQPRPRGASVFRDVHFYDELPATYRVGYGVDLAYTAKTQSDYCCAVVLAASGQNYYVLDVKREQSTPPAFAARLREIEATYPGAKGLWYTSTTEIGLSDLLKESMGFRLRGEIATADKFVRAQPVAAAWNETDAKPGRVFIPRSAPWAAAFTSELMSFTGVNDRHDDQVDALAAAFDVLRLPQAPNRGVILPRPSFEDRTLG